MKVVTLIFVAAGGYLIACAVRYRNDIQNPPESDDPTRWYWKEDVKPRQQDPDHDYITTLDRSRAARHRILRRRSSQI